MSRLWLPTGRKPYANPKDEREILINRLWELRYGVPGARQMELQQLRDYVAFAEKRVEEQQAEDEKDALAATAKMAKMTPDQITGAIKEFLNWKYRKAGEQKKYHDV